MKVKNTIEKAKVSDVLITLDGELIHLEIETGTDEPTKVKNLSNFFSVYSENTLRGEEYDTKTKFVHIVLQFGIKNNKEIKHYYISSDDGIL